MPNMPKRPERKDLVAKPRRSVGLPSLEKLFPRTTTVGRMSRAEGDEAFARGDLAESAGKSVRGALAGGLIAFPADVVEGVSKAVPEPVKNWFTGRTALDFGRGLFGKSAPSETAPAKTEQQAAAGATPKQPVARPMSKRDQVQNTLMQLARPGTGVQVATPSIGEIDIPAAPELPAPVDRAPRESPIAQSRLPVLPERPTYGDLMAFRLNALQQGMQAVPRVGAERQTRQAVEEGQAEDTLNLKRFDLKRLTRQGDQELLTDKIDMARKQGNADRTADVKERRLKLDVLRELNEDEPTFSDQMKELDAKRDFLNNYWEYGDELGEAAFDLAKETGIPVQNLQPVLAEEIAAAEEAQGSFTLDSAKNIEKMKAQLRKRVLEAR